MSTILAFRPGKDTDSRKVMLERQLKINLDHVRSDRTMGMVSDDQANKLLKHLRACIITNNLELKLGLSTEPLILNA